MFVLLMTIFAGDAPKTAETRAVEACADVLEAGRDMSAGKRLPSSYVEVTRAAEAEARVAAAQDRRYEAVHEAIASIRAAMETGRPERAAPGAQFLGSQCG
jgi:hypothetical protein